MMNGYEIRSDSYAQRENFRRYQQKLVHPKKLKTIRSTEKKDIEVIAKDIPIHPG